MTSFCDAHAFDCGCTDRCAKTIDLGRFKKTTAPVFQFTVRDMAFVAFIIAAMTFVAGITIQSAFERVNLANQETAQW